MEQSRTAGAAKMLAGQALEMSGMLILAMPGIVLATGFFLLLNTPLACHNLLTAL